MTLSPLTRAGPSGGGISAVEPSCFGAQPAFLESRIGTFKVLVRQGEWRLHLLNASAAWLWDRLQLANPGSIDSEHELSHQVAKEFGLTASLAASHVTRALECWRQAGLIAPTPLHGLETGWVIPPPAPRLPATGERVLAVAGQAFGLVIDSDALADLLRGPLRRLRVTAPRERTQALRLMGEPVNWTLSCDGQELATGDTQDAAIVGVLASLIDLACRAEDRLLVIHGAGLAHPDGGGYLLVAPGGSGKTTLAAALNAEGHALLSDDVVPVRRDGRLLALNTPICLKAGSWPVLADRRPDLAAQPVIQRYGQPIRYLPPLGPVVSEALPPRLLLFPRYRPDGPPEVTRLEPELALRHIVEAEAVIRDLTQAKLDDLTAWIGALPAYALSYPDLATGLAQVRSLLDAGD